MTNVTDLTTRLAALVSAVLLATVSLTAAVGPAVTSLPIA